MTTAEKILIMENRLHKLKENQKNTNSFGVIKKLERKILRLKQL